MRIIRSTLEEAYLEAVEGGAGVTGVGVIAMRRVRECTRRRVFGRRRRPDRSLPGALHARHRHGVRPSGAARRRATTVDVSVLAGATLLGLAMFATLFLSTVLAVFLTFSVLRGDAEQGLLQPMVVRPLGRAAFLVARFGAAAAVSAAYAAAVYAAAIVITGLAGAGGPTSSCCPAIELAAGAVIVTASRSPGRCTSRRSRTASPSSCCSAPGWWAACSARSAMRSTPTRLSSIGDDHELGAPVRGALPGGLHALTGQTSGITGVIVHLGPLGGAQPAGPLLAPWVLGYTVARRRPRRRRVRTRRDL